MLSFMQEDLECQSMSGHVNPIDVGEWSSPVSTGKMEKLLEAIYYGDRDAVTQFLK